MKSLLPYQEAAVQEITKKLWEEDKNGRILCMRTGAGKTVTSMAIIQHALNQRKGVLVLAHTSMLVTQLSRELEEWGLDASVSTGRRAYNRLLKDINHFGKIDLLTIDECHRVRPKDKRGDGNQYFKLIQLLKEANPGLRVLGLSASPIRLDKADVMEVFDGITYGPSFQELIDIGRLMLPTGYDIFQFSKVPVKNGEYDRSVITKLALENGKLDEQIASWVGSHQGSKAFIFCATKAHCEHVRDILGDGYIVVSDDTPEEEREELAAKLGAGEIKGLINCNILTEGVDIPAADLLVNLSPTKSLVRYLQRVGRIVRTHPGKERCVILDFAGSIREHGLPEMDYDFEAMRQKRGEAGEAPTKTCESCRAVCHASAKECPQCGTLFPVKEKPVEVATKVMTLEELRDNELGQIAKALEPMFPGYARYFPASVRRTINRGYKPESAIAHFIDGFEAKSGPISGTQRRAIWGFIQTIKRIVKSDEKWKTESQLRTSGIAKFKRRYGAMRWT